MPTDNTTIETTTAPQEYPLESRVSRLEAVLAELLENMPHVGPNEAQHLLEILSED